VTAQHGPAWVQPSHTGVTYKVPAPPPVPHPLPSPPHRHMTSTRAECVEGTTLFSLTGRKAKTGAVVVAVDSLSLLAVTMAEKRKLSIAPHALSAVLAASLCVAGSLSDDTAASAPMNEAVALGAQLLTAGAVSTVLSVVNRAVTVCAQGGTGLRVVLGLPPSPDPVTVPVAPSPLILRGLASAVTDLRCARFRDGVDGVACAVAASSAIAHPLFLDALVTGIRDALAATSPAVPVELALVRGPCKGRTSIDALLPALASSTSDTVFVLSPAAELPFHVAAQEACTHFANAYVRMVASAAGRGFAALT
jgi:hypothetical protein